MTQEEEMTEVGRLLKNAETFGMSIEVVYYALKSMKHTHIDPVSAMMQGCYEWDIPTTKIEEKDE